MALTGKAAFVTGATGGIGKAICLALARSGADVGICYHTQPEVARQIKREIEAFGRKAVTVRADVSLKSEVFAAIGDVQKQLGPIDILVNNAGITLTGKLEEIVEEDWDRVLAVNLKSVFLCMQAVIPEMKQRRQGVIINVSSMAAKVGGINSGAPYSASKAGVSCLTIQAAKELLSFGINVNAVAPGMVDTPLWDCYGPEKKEATVRSLVRGAGCPEDIAEAVVFLASPGARYITGEILDVNGGILMD
jgi:3-oxoacyl-[acyl-carrier protein] reductase